MGFTELILTGERVEAGIKNGKIQKDASSATVRKPFTGKKEVVVVYSQRNQDRAEHLQWWCYLPLNGGMTLPQGHSHRLIP